MIMHCGQEPCTKGTSECTDGPNDCTCCCHACCVHVVEPPAMPTPDPVAHPSHYTDGKIEVLDFIIDKGFGEGFCLGNAIKYICRAGKKDPSKYEEDLRKAKEYIDLWLARRPKSEIPF